MSTAVSRVTLHIDTARKCAIAPSGGQISVILRASDCRFGGSREPSDFCNRLLAGERIVLRRCKFPWPHGLTGRFAMGSESGAGQMLTRSAVLLRVPMCRSPDWSRTS